MNSLASQAELVNLRETVEAQKRIINSQREKLQWFEGTLGNKDIPINLRLAMIATKQLEETGHPGEDGFYRAHLPRLADSVGVSPSTISRALRKLADCTEAVEHRTETDALEPYKHIVYIRPTDALDRPQDIIPTKEIARHGGDHRIVCAECGSDDIVEQKKHVCRSCGTVVKEFEPRAMNTPLHLATGEIEDRDPSRCILQPIPLHRGGMVARLDAIPAELKNVAHWMPWQYGNKLQKNGKFPKVPRDAAGKMVDYTNPKNWMTFDQAVASCNAGQFDGIGYVFSKDDPFTGIDLDHCRDKETGAITEEAQDINRLLSTYGEISPSGTGLKWIARGTVAHSGKLGDLEMYDHKRFFAITGDRHPDAEPTIEYRQAQLTRLNGPIAEKHATKDAAAMPPSVYASNGGLNDSQVLEKCRNGKNSARFERLWTGDWSGYPSQSEADQALCEELAYRSDRRDRDMVDHLFRQSGLYREKWERADYRERTLDRAMGVQVSA